MPRGPRLPAEVRRHIFANTEPITAGMLVRHIGGFILAALVFITLAAYVPD